jgi:hypothetical protein
LGLIDWALNYWSPLWLLSQDIRSLTHASLPFVFSLERKTPKDPFFFNFPLLLVTQSRDRNDGVKKQCA